MLCSLMNMQSTVDINFIVSETECGLEVKLNVDFYFTIHIKVSLKVAKFDTVGLRCMLVLF